MRRRRIAVVSALFLLATVVLPETAAAVPTRPEPAAPAAETALSNGQVQLALKVSGLSQPIGVVNAGDGTDRLFIVEQRGTVRVFNGTSLVAGFFLDIRNVAGGISTGGERGLLGLAFHPSFESNRKLFVYYTNGGGDLVIAEMTANAARTSAAAGTVDSLMTIEHTANTNHNGGQLLFGPDGYLYIFTGDGGGAGDPNNYAQNINSPLGKTLRIAPNLTGSYTNPAGNPYLGVAGDDRIWSIGLRNPWRASFDRSTGSLWMADVGQGTWEEVNREPANTPGRNYGWSCREGTSTFKPGCSGLTLINPTAQYSSAGSSPHCSVVGGYVYRGSVFPDFVGQYVVGDYCSGYIWTLAAGAGSPTFQQHQNTTALITSFGESESGEIFMTDHGGRLYRVVAPPFSDVASSFHIDDITWLYHEGITDGCGGGRYCPKSSVTREQMASFLVRALSLPSTTTDYFNDDNGSFHEDDINALAAAGVTTGCRTGQYCPTGTVTREQMASFLVRGYDLPPSGTNYFTDDNGSFHEDDINALAASGVTTGCAANRFCPRSSTTREQMASFLRGGLGVALVVGMVTATAPRAPVTAGSEAIPDLAMKPLSDFQIQWVNGRRMLRFTAMMVNVGSGHFEVRGSRANTSQPMIVNQVIYETSSRSSPISRTIATGAHGKWSGDGHNHWHVQEMMRYDMWGISGTMRGAKVGFCFLDSDPFNLSLPGAGSSSYYRGSWCQTTPSALNNRMGISIGWGDEYEWYLAWQWVDITGVPSGTYTVRSKVDPYGFFLEENEANQCAFTRVRFTTTSNVVTVLGSGTTCVTDWQDSPFAADIDWMWQAGLTNGCGPELYCPNQRIPREQMAAFLNRALDLPATSTDFFTDDGASQFQDDINRLAAAGITTGCTTTRFCPKGTVTREQMASFLVRALSLPSSSTDYFTDDGASTHHDDINALAEAGITNGCTATRFCPSGVVTRAEMAAFLHRALGDT